MFYEVMVEMDWVEGFYVLGSVIVILGYDYNLCKFIVYSKLDCL